MQGGFGRFLISRGVVDEPQLFRALTQQNSMRPDPVLLAVQEHFISVEQALTILDEMRADRATFEQAALDSRYLTDVELRRLRDASDRVTPPVGELLVAMGALSSERLRMELVAWRAARR